MKYLILLLISLNSFADVKIEISNLKGSSYRAKFETQNKANAWIADNISNDSWGKKERWVKFKKQKDCLEKRDVLNRKGKVKYQDCKMPVQYTIVQTDITKEIKNAKDLKKAKKAKIKNLKDKAKNMKLNELIELLELKGLI